MAGGMTRCFGRRNFPDGDWSAADVIYPLPLRQPNLDLSPIRIRAAGVALPTGSRNPRPLGEMGSGRHPLPATENPLFRPSLFLHRAGWVKAISTRPPQNLRYDRTVLGIPDLRLGVHGPAADPVLSDPQDKGARA